MIAAERIDRAARLVEYEPRYVDRIIARWEALTGDKATLVAADAPEEQTRTEANPVDGDNYVEE